MRQRLFFLLVFVLYCSAAIAQRNVDSNNTALTAFTPFHDIDQTNAHHSFPEISAHRGASRVAPENTLAAFTKAIEMGADFIEIDVRTNG